LSYPASNKEKLSNFFFVIYKRKWLLLFFFIATYLGIVAGTWLAPQYYKATTKIFIHTNPKLGVSLFSDLEEMGERGTRVNLAQDMVQILTSEGMARKIVDEFELDKLYYKRNYEPESFRDIVWFYIHKVFDVIEAPYTYSKLLLVHLGLIEAETGKEDYPFLAMADFLDDWLDVQAERESRVVNLTIWGPEPRLASNIANRMAKLLIDQTLMMTQDKAVSGYNFTASQIKNVENKYYDSQDKLEEFRKKNNIVAMKEQKENLVSQFKRFETDMAEIDADLKGTLEKANEIRSKLDSEKEKVMKSKVTGNNPIVMELRSEINKLEISLSSMRLEMTDKNAAIIELKAKINDARKKLREEMEEIMVSKTEDINPVYQSLRQQLIELQAKQIFLSAKKDAFQHTISKIKKELSALPQKEIEFNKLETISDIYTNIYRVVKDKFEKLLILKANEVNEFGLSIITHTKLPDIMPVTWPMWDINTIYVGLPLSIFIAFFIVFFVDYWSDTFSTKKEVEFNLELPVIGIIPDFKKKKVRRL